MKLAKDTLSASVGENFSWKAFSVSDLSNATATYILYLDEKDLENYYSFTPTAYDIIVLAAKYSFRCRFYSKCSSQRD